MRRDLWSSNHYLAPAVGSPVCVLDESRYEGIYRSKVLGEQLFAGIKLDVAEIRMLRWMSGVITLERIRNERIRGTTKVGELSKKVQGSRLKWYGHVSRREQEYMGKRVMVIEVRGKRRKGRPNRKWLDNIRNNLSERIVRGGSVRPS